jgi:hypothetical protein
VYNIEVEGEHCYRVGQQGLLVHNASAQSDCAKMGLKPGDSKVLSSTKVTVYRRTSLTSAAGKAVQYLRVDSKIASLDCKSIGTSGLKGCDTSPDRDPSDLLKELVQFGSLDNPVQNPARTLGKDTDDVGHIVANMFGGYAGKHGMGLDNVFPQNAYINEVDYKNWELYQVKLEVESGCETCLLWEFKYDKSPATTPHRPSSFRVKWWSGGGIRKPDRLSGVGDWWEFPNP